MIEIIRAINERHCIKFKYKEESTYRKADAYIIGINSGGELMVRAYQISDGWKLFKVNQMNDVTVTTEKCLNKIGYNPLDHFFKKIIKQV